MRKGCTRGLHGGGLDARGRNTQIRGFAKSLVIFCYLLLFINWYSGSPIRPPFGPIHPACALPASTHAWIPPLPSAHAPLPLAYTLLGDVEFAIATPADAIAIILLRNAQFWNEYIGNALWGRGFWNRNECRRDDGSGGSASRRSVAQATHLGS